MPYDLLFNMTQWLTMRDSMQLMQTSRRNKRLMDQAYKDRLRPLGKDNPIKTRYFCPAYWYHRHPGQRFEQYLPTDHPGMSYLHRLGIEYPLTERIKNERLSVEGALSFVAAQRRSLDSALSSETLTQQQKSFLRNGLFREHLLTGHLSMEAALRLAQNEMTLFYSLTLRPFFRAGYLEPLDLEKISAAGFQLLHDPCLAQLILKQRLSKDQLLNLTDNQLTALRICLPSLLDTSTRLATHEALALTETQIDLLCSSGMADEIYLKRATLSYVLPIAIAISDLSDQKSRVTEPSSCSLSSRGMSSSSMSSGDRWSSGSSPSSSALSSSDVTCPGRSQHTTDPFARYASAATYLNDLDPSVDKSKPDERYARISSGTAVTLEFMLATPLRALLISDDNEYSMPILHAYRTLIPLLSVNDIIQFLDTSSDEESSVFAAFDDGLDSDGAAETACVYMSYYVILAAHVSSTDFLRIVRPFLENVFGIFVREGVSSCYERVIHYCETIWSLTRSRCAMAGTDIAALRELAKPLLIEEDFFECTAGRLNCRGYTCFGQLLYSMGLVGDERFFNAWIPGWSVDEFQEGLISADQTDYFHALLTPHAAMGNATALLDLINERNRQRFHVT